MKWSPGQQTDAPSAPGAGWHSSLAGVLFSLSYAQLPRVEFLKHAGQYTGFSVWLTSGTSNPLHQQIQYGLRLLVRHDACLWPQSQIVYGSEDTVDI